MSGKKLSRVGIVLASALLLSSCFTTTLWKTEEIEPRRHGIAHRLCLTPFTILLDLLTWPFQEAFWNDDC